MKDARQFANYKKAIASRELIMLATVGSTVLGLANSNSDIDEMGICIETPEDLLGFSTFEQTIYRTAQDRTGKFDAKSEAGDIDLTIYGLRKFVRLALGGNPNLITMLYLEPKHCSVHTPLAAELQTLRAHFIAKSTFNAYLGYAKAQRLKMTASRGTNPANPNGFDVKYGLHFLRLMMQAYDLLVNGYIRFPMHEDNLRKLRMIYRGEYSLGDIVDSAHGFERSIHSQVTENDSIPEQPNHKEIEQWLLNVYKERWAGQKAVAKKEQLNSDPNIQF